MGASCCLIGKTRSTTLTYTARWLGGWFDHALKRMKTAAELARSLRAVTTSDAVRIITNAIDNQLMEDFFDKGDHERPLSEQIHEISSNIEKGNIRQDFYMMSHVNDGRENNSYHGHFTLTLIPRVFRESPETDTVSEKTIDEYKGWFVDYISFLEKRCLNGTISYEYEDTIYLPKELIPLNNETSSMSEYQKTTYNILQYFAKTSRVDLKIVVDESGGSFSISPDSELKPLKLGE